MRSEVGVYDVEAGGMKPDDGVLYMEVGGTRLRVGGICLGAGRVRL